AGNAELSARPSASSAGLECLFACPANPAAGTPPAGADLKAKFAGGGGAAAAVGTSKVPATAGADSGNAGFSATLPALRSANLSFSGLLTEGAGADATEAAPAKPFALTAADFPPFTSLPLEIRSCFARDAAWLASATVLRRAGASADN